jgi:hypothetical protein
MRSWCVQQRHGLRAATELRDLRFDVQHRHFVWRASCASVLRQYNRLMQLHQLSKQVERNELLYLPAAFQRDQLQ